MRKQRPKEFGNRHQCCKNSNHVVIHHKWPTTIHRTSLRDQHRFSCNLQCKLRLRVLTR